MKKVDYFHQDELKKIFDEIKKNKKRYWLRDICMFRIAYRCGLRASEIGLITKADFNPQKKELYCRRLKNSVSNTIKLDQETAKLLGKFIREYGLDNANGILFKSQLKKPISRQQLDVLMRKYCKMAGVSGESRWHFHVLKHCIAVHLAESGLDIKELQYYLGHKNVSSTFVYFQFTTKQKEQMYLKLEKEGQLV